MRLKYQKFREEQKKKWKFTWRKTWQTITSMSELRDNNQIKKYHKPKQEHSKDGGHSISTITEEEITFYSFPAVQTQAHVMGQASGIKKTYKFVNIHLELSPGEESSPFFIFLLRIFTFFVESRIMLNFHPKVFVNRNGCNFFLSVHWNRLLFLSLSNIHLHKTLSQHWSKHFPEGLSLINTWNK